MSGIQIKNKWHSYHYSCTVTVLSLLSSLAFFLGGGGWGRGGELKITFVLNLDNIIAHNLCKKRFF